VAKSLLEDKRNETTLNARYTEVDVREIGDPRRVPGHIWKNGESNLNSMGVHGTRSGSHDHSASSVDSFVFGPLLVIHVLRYLGI
jgi:hypothetical protein